MFAVDGVLEAGVGRLNESRSVYGTNSDRSIDFRQMALDAPVRQIVQFSVRRYVRRFAVKITLHWVMNFSSSKSMSLYLATTPCDGTQIR